MASNESPNPGPFTPRTLFPTTPSRQSPSDAAAVTQSPQGSVLDPQDISKTREDHSDFHYHSLHYDDDQFPGQSPALQSPTVARMPVRIQHSPGFSSQREVAAALLQMHSSHPEKRQLSRETIMNRNKKSRVCYSVKSNILTFLRPPLVAKSISEYDFRYVHKSAHNSWQNKKQVTYSPFPKPRLLKQRLMKSPIPLTFRHRRLLVEDIMLLEPGESVVLLMSQKHPFLKDKDALGKHWMKKLLEGWDVKPVQAIQFSSTVYFAMDVTVSANHYYDRMNGKDLEEDAIIKMCMDSGGGGVHLMFPHCANPLFKFQQFLEHPIDLQLWHVGNS